MAFSVAKTIKKKFRSKSEDRSSKRAAQHLGWASDAELEAELESRNYEVNGRTLRRRNKDINYNLNALTWGARAESKKLNRPLPKRPVPPQTPQAVDNGTQTDGSDSGSESDNERPTGIIQQVPVKPARMRTQMKDEASGPDEKRRSMFHPMRANSPAPATDSSMIEVKPKHRDASNMGECSKSQTNNLFMQSVADLNDLTVRGGDRIEVLRTPQYYANHKPSSAYPSHLLCSLNQCGSDVECDKNSMLDSFPYHSGDKVGRQCTGKKKVPGFESDYSDDMIGDDHYEPHCPSTPFTTAHTFNANHAQSSHSPIPRLTDLNKNHNLMNYTGSIQQVKTNKNKNLTVDNRLRDLPIITRDQVSRSLFYNPQVDDVVVDKRSEARTNLHRRSQVEQELFEPRPTHNVMRRVHENIGLNEVEPQPIPRGFSTPMVKSLSKNKHRHRFVDFDLGSSEEEEIRRADNSVDNRGISMGTKRGEVRQPTRLNELDSEEESWHTPSQHLSSYSKNSKSSKGSLYVFPPDSFDRCSEDGNNERRSHGNGSGSRKSNHDKNHNKNKRNHGGDGGDPDPDDSGDDGSNGNNGFNNNRSNHGAYTSSQVNVVAFHGRTPDIEKYSNSYKDSLNFDQLVEKFEMHAAAMAIPKELWARVFVLNLTGAAMMIYKNVVSDKPSLADDFDGLVKELKKKFSHRGGMTKSTELFSRVKDPSESTSEYFQVISTLAKQSFPSLDSEGLDEIITTQFIRGLDDKCKQYLMNKGPMNAYQAYTAAERFESTGILMRSSHRNSGSTNALTHNEQNQLMNNMTRSVQDLNIRERDRTAQNRGPNNYSRPRYQDSRNSYNRNFGFSSNNGSRGYGYSGDRQYSSSRHPYGNRSDNFRGGDRPRQQVRFDFRDRDESRFDNRRRFNNEAWPRNQNSDRQDSNRYTWRGAPICRICNRPGHLDISCNQRRDNYRENNGHRGDRSDYSYTQPSRDRPTKRTSVVYESGHFTNHVNCLVGSETGVSENRSIKSTKSTNKYYQIPGWICALLVQTVMVLWLFSFPSTLGALHNVNPMICPSKGLAKGAKSHLLVQMPKARECSLYEEHKSSVQPLRLKFYKQRPVLESERGYLCYKKVTKVSTFLYAFYEERLHRENTEFIAVSPLECWEMVYNHRIDGKNLYQKDGVFSTHIEPARNYHYCCRWFTETFENYVVEFGALYLDRNTGGIKTSLGNTAGCRYEHGTCETSSNGVMVWEPKKEETCWFIEWVQKEGEYYNGHWLSAEKNLALTFKDNGFLNFTICDGTGANATVWKSDQGIFVQPMNNVSLDGYKSLIARPTAGNITTGLSAHALSMIEILDSVGQALAIEIQKVANKVFFSTIETLCAHENMVLTFLKSALRSGPTTTIRELLQDPYIVAHVLTTDVISIDACQEISNYSIISNNDTECSDKIPISYYWQDKLWFGYLDTVTKIIHKNSLKTTCALQQVNLIKLNNTLFEYNWDSGLMTTLDNVTDDLSRYFYQNFTLEDTPLIVFRRENGLLPISEVGSDNDLLNDFIQVIAREREIMRQAGFWPSTEDSTDGFDIGNLIGNHNLFSFFRSGLGR